MLTILGQKRHVFGSLAKTGNRTAPYGLVSGFCRASRNRAGLENTSPNRTETEPNDTLDTASDN
jgi:hypothetical protein